MSTHHAPGRVDEPAGVVAIAALIFFAGLAAVLPLFFWLTTLV